MDDIRPEKIILRQSQKSDLGSISQHNEKYRINLSLPARSPTPRAASPPQPQPLDLEDFEPKASNASVKPTEPTRRICGLRPRNFISSLVVALLVSFGALAGGLYYHFTSFHFSCNGPYVASPSLRVAQGNHTYQIFEWQGCYYNYNDPNPSPNQTALATTVAVVDITQNPGSQMNNMICAEKCKGSNYFGTSQKDSGTACMCGDVLSSYFNSTCFGCNQPCPTANTSTGLYEPCGGYGYVTLYKSDD